MNISEINPPMIEKFKQKRLEGETMYKRKRNPATVNRELCVLSKIFSLAFDAELIDSNPCRRVRKLRTETRRTRYLTFDEEARLFEQLEGQEWVQRIVTMAINTGMRQAPCPKLLILLVEQRGVEPLTSALRTRRSAKLSYCPTRSAILGSAVEECQGVGECVTDFRNVLATAMGDLGFATAAANPRSPMA